MLPANRTVTLPKTNTKLCSTNRQLKACQTLSTWRGSAVSSMKGVNIATEQTATEIGRTHEHQGKHIGYGTYWLVLPNLCINQEKRQSMHLHRPDVTKWGSTKGNLLTSTLYPLSTIDDIHPEVSNVKVFSKVNLTHGYWYCEFD